MNHRARANLGLYGTFALARRLSAIAALNLACSNANPANALATDAGVDSGTPACGATPTALPASCAPGGKGLTNCGACAESCCASLEVTGGDFARTFVNSGSGPEGAGDTATVSSFRLDKYEVTVGRFREFVLAWNGGAGWTPPAGAGKHVALNAGKGLSVAAGGNEAGWHVTDNANIAPTDAHLACNAYATWTTSPSTHEALPINCVSWYEASAFCIWDAAFLPSEAEWEYAAVGGAEQREYPWGNVAPGTDNQRQIYACDYPGGSGHCTDVTNLAPVGSTIQGAGRWGQLDLTGNVEEWVLDYYTVPFPTGTCADCAALTPTSKRSIRGGNYSEDASTVLPTWRDANIPAARNSYSGIRCARSAL